MQHAKIWLFFSSFDVMNVKDHAVEIVRTFVRQGYIAYFAGGWVRDYLMGHPSADIDIATDAPPQVILDLFPNSLIVGLTFGVVIVVIGGHQFEVATFRRDIDYIDGRKPQAIALSSPREDALRRDFTINGMFYDPLDDTIYDYVGGKADIKKGIIRTIGNPNERFVEDRLRMIRAVRFACRFGFTIDPDTQQGISENAETLLPAVAMERVWQELNKMAQGPAFARALIEMHRLHLLPEIFPSLRISHLHDVKEQVAAFTHFPPSCPTILHLLVLFPNASLEQKQDLCRSLRTSNKEIALVKLEGRCRELMQCEKDVNDVEWVYFYADEHVQVVLEAVAATLTEEHRSSFLEKHKLRRESFALHIARVIKRKPLVNAAELKARGVQEGPHMGALLKQAEYLAITLDLNDPLQVIAEMNKMSLI